MTIRSQLFPKEPLWRENRLGTRHQLPEDVQSWTYETGSLTQRLRRSYGSAVKVRILWQRWQTPFLTEQHRLQLSPRTLAWVREVLLYAGDKPLILARTVIPAETIRFAHSNLAKLGTRPLGEVIFSYPKLARLQLDLALIQPPAWTPETCQLANINQAVWGRRTVYGLKHQHLLVSEFFLADSLNL